MDDYAMLVAAIDWWADEHDRGRAVLTEDVDLHEWVVMVRVEGELKNDVYTGGTPSAALVEAWKAWKARQG